MKTDITITVEDRLWLERLMADGNTPAKVVWRAQIVLATADGESVKAIARTTGKSKPCVWRWQRRFADHGIDGLLRDKTRPPGRKPLKAKVLAKTASETPPDATHWSVRTMARAMGISYTSVQRIWREAGLKPHLTARFKVSSDPQFEEKVTDIVGLYMSPPDKALAEPSISQKTALFWSETRIQVPAWGAERPDGGPDSSSRRRVAFPTSRNVMSRCLLSSQSAPRTQRRLWNSVSRPTAASSG